MVLYTMIDSFSCVFIILEMALSVVLPVFR